MKRRIRALCLIAAGLLAAATPLLIAQQPAGASDNTAGKQVMITFVDDNGQEVTCGLNDSADHNTDDPNQPYTSVNADLSGGAPCYQDVDLEVTVNYKDKNGVGRQSTAGASTTGLRVSAYGTYSSITVTAKAHYYECDSSVSATCDLSVTVAPK